MSVLSQNLTNWLLIVMYFNQYVAKVCYWAVCWQMYIVAKQARELVQTMLSAQVVVSQAGPEVIRLTPSLLIRDQEREEGLKRMKRVLEIWKLTHASP